MATIDRVVDTPTVARLRAERSLRRPRGYGIWLTDQDLEALNDVELAPSTVLAFACIKSAAIAAGGDDWVALRSRVMKAMGRDYRWWFAQTQLLVRAGFLDVDRHRGRLPRYRLRKISSGD